MSLTDVEKRVVEVFRKVLGEKTGFSASDLKRPLKEVSTMDSLSALRIMVAIENEFRLKFDLDNLEEAFHSVESIARYIQARTGKGPKR